MVVRRNDARRRRLVIDPAAHTGDANAPVSGKSKGKKASPSDVRTYSYGADRRSQRKTTDLIPKRLLSFLLVILVLLTVIGLLNFAHSRAADWETQLGSQAVQAFAIQGQGSLASWFSSFLLIVTGLASLQIYALRQHRCDDYGGTYRLWIWMAALFLVASMGCVVNLEAITASLAKMIFPQSLRGYAWMPTAIKLSALSLLVLRGIYEVRASRGSLALVIFVWLAYITAMIMQIPATKQILVHVNSELVAGNCIVIGTVGLLLAHLTYARFVFLQAHGLTSLRIKKSKARKKTAPQAEKASSVKKRVATKKPTTKKTAAATKTNSRKSLPKAPKTTSSPAKKSKVSKKSPTAPVTSATPSPTAKSKPANPVTKSAKLTLQEMAAASREKTKAKRPQTESTEIEAPAQGVIKMSKAQRRKQRKLEKQRRRAA